MEHELFVALTNIDNKLNYLIKQLTDYEEEVKKQEGKNEKDKTDNDSGKEEFEEIDSDDED